MSECTREKSPFWRGKKKKEKGCDCEEKGFCCGDTRKGRERGRRIFFVVAVAVAEIIRNMIIYVDRLWFWVVMNDCL